MTLPPIHLEIAVPATPAQAFDGFIEEIVGWWPMDLLSLLGPGSLVSFEEDELVEMTVDGTRAIWARTRVSEPGVRLVLDWHPGTPEAVSTVALDFIAIPEGSQVTLEHSDWEAFDEPELARAQYEQAWPTVLAAYTDQFPGAAEASEEG